MAVPERNMHDDAIRFPSMDSLRAAHTELLKRFRTEGRPSEMIMKIEQFIQRGKATGTLLDEDADRWEDACLRQRRQYNSVLGRRHTPAYRATTARSLGPGI